MVRFLGQEDPPREGTVHRAPEPRLGCKSLVHCIGNIAARSATVRGRNADQSGLIRALWHFPSDERWPTDHDLQGWPLVKLKPWKELELSTSILFSHLRPLGWCFNNPTQIKLSHYFNSLLEVKTRSNFTWILSEAVQNGKRLLNRYQLLCYYTLYLSPGCNCSKIFFNRKLKTEEGGEPLVNKKGTTCENERAGKEGGQEVCVFCTKMYDSVKAV